MSRRKHENQVVRQLLDEILKAGRAMPTPMTAEEMANRVGIAPETLSRMKTQGRAEMGVIVDLAGLVGLRLQLAPQDDLKHKMLTGTFFDNDR